jgi:hypothetical protein
MSVLKLQTFATDGGISPVIGNSCTSSDMLCCWG